MLKKKKKCNHEHLHRLLIKIIPIQRILKSRLVCFKQHFSCEIPKYCLHQSICVFMTPGSNMASFIE